MSGHYYNSFYHTNSYLVLLDIYSLIELHIKRLRLLLGQAVNHNLLGSRFNLSSPRVPLVSGIV